MCVNNIKTQTQHKIHETHNNTSTNHVLPSHNKIFDKIKVFFHHHDTREHKNFGPRVSVAVLPFSKKKKKKYRSPGLFRFWDACFENDRGCQIA